MWRECLLLSRRERIDIRLSPDGWRIAYVRGGATLLAYEGDSGAARCLRGGMARPYRFRSVEQLRYDFDRDLQALRDGELR